MATNISWNLCMNTIFREQLATWLMGHLEVSKVNSKLVLVYFINRTWLGLISNSWFGNFNPDSVKSVGEKLVQILSVVDLWHKTCTGATNHISQSRSGTLHFFPSPYEWSLPFCGGCCHCCFWSPATISVFFCSSRLGTRISCQMWWGGTNMGRDGGSSSSQCGRMVSSSSIREAPNWRCIAVSCLEIASTVDKQGRRFLTWGNLVAMKLNWGQFSDNRWRRMVYKLQRMWVFRIYYSVMVHGQAGSKYCVNTVPKIGMDTSNSLKIQTHNVVSWMLFS